jgi:hypothetical protein
LIKGETMRVLFLLLLITFCLGAVPALASVDAEGPSRNSALLKSALVPGLGQIEQGRTGRGAIWAGAATTLGLATFYSHIQYHSAAEDFNNAGDLYRAAIAAGDGDEALLQFTKMESHGTLAEDRYDTRRLLEIGLVLVWAGNLVDTWFFEGDGSGDDRADLPGRLEPVITRGGAAGLAWTIDF